MSLDVSVIVPSFNRAHLIGETLDGILAQTHAAAEVIVVDDGSTDATAAVVGRYGLRVRYHRVESPGSGNIGPSAARNVGSSIARSAWLAFCDSDDLWLPTKLERQLRVHALHPGLECSITDFCFVTAGRWQSPSVFATAPPGYWEAGRRIVETNVWIYESSLYERVLRFQPSRASTLLISRRRFDALGGFPDLFSLGLSEDLEFTLRNLGWPPIGILAEVQVGQRRHDGNRSLDLVRNWLDQVRILEYAQATHPAAKLCADVLADEIQKRRVYAMIQAFAAGRLDIVRDLSPSIEPPYRDWKTATKIAVAALPKPLATALRRALVAANAYLSK